MARPSKLADPDVREEFIKLMTAGVAFEAAAKSLNMSPRAAYRYKVADPEFAAVVEQLLAAGIGKQVKAAVKKAKVKRRQVKPLRSEERRPPTKPAPQPPAAPDLPPPPATSGDDWLDTWGNPGRTTSKNPQRPGIPTAQRFMEVLWVRFLRDGKDAKTYARILAPVLLGPQIREQERQAKLMEMADEQRRELGDGQGGGMIVLEVPRNPARPHLNDGPGDRVVDAEFSESR